jgi:Cu+-exporting ATPase
LISIGNGVAAWLLHDSVSFGVQVVSVSLLAAVPVTSFITLSRPTAVLQKKLHKLGAVLCGWQGIVGLSGRAVFPIKHGDLFPVGSCKLNGVKFYGSRDPDQVVAYCTALVTADGGGLVPLFEHLLNSRNGRHYAVVNFRGYTGGIGGEVCGEPVLLGTANCLKELGVEIPEGTSVNNAVYAAIDGEFCGVFAVTYSKIRSSAMGLRTLCAYRKLRLVMTSGDFMLTDTFVRSRFGVNSRRIHFPDRDVREELNAVEPDAESPALAIITGKGFAPFAFAVTGARSLRTSLWVGVAIHMFGGIVGLAMMILLSVLGSADLLTPQNLLLYELIWLIPGLLFTEWTRAV